MQGQQLLGITGVQSNAGGGMSINITFNEDDCGCITPPPAPGGTVTWQNIVGIPSCMLDCNVLQQYIIQYGLTDLKDSDEIVVVADDAGLLKLYLVDRGIVAKAYGSASKTVTVSVNEKGVITDIEEVDIEIAADQVTYENDNYPQVTNVLEMLDSLALIVSRQSYVHTQASAATTWNINHNMGKRPSITIIDSTGDLSVAKPSYTDVNNLTLTFSEAVAGTAYLN